MQTMHAIAAGLGAPVRLRPVLDQFSGSGGSALAKDKAAGAANHTAALDAGHIHFADVAQALQIHNLMAGLPALVERFGCGIAHDLGHMTISELAGLHSHLKMLEGRA